MDKFKYMHEIKRIKKHTHVPKAILKAAAIKIPSPRRLQP